jgi:hypothetical protein
MAKNYSDSISLRPITNSWSVRYDRLCFQNQDAKRCDTVLSDKDVVRMF